MNVIAYFLIAYFLGVLTVIGILIIRWLLAKPKVLFCSRCQENVAHYRRETLLEKDKFSTNRWFCWACGPMYEPSRSI